MSDYERYMDYNGVHDDDHLLHPPAKWVMVLKALCKWLFVLACLFVVGLLAFRLAFAGWYPRFAKKLYMTPAISEAYAENGTLTALTQTLAVPWEDRNSGYYMADNLIVVKESGSIQVSLRVNENNYALIAQAVGLTEDYVRENLTFTLYYGAEDTPLTYSTAKVIKDKKLLYDYYKICFDGVDLSQNIPWYRLNIHITGYADSEAEPLACIVVYENNEEYNIFEPYRLSKGELRS